MLPKIGDATVFLTSYKLFKPIKAKKNSMAILCPLREAPKRNCKSIPMI